MHVCTAGTYGAQWPGGVPEAVPEKIQVRLLVSRNLHPSSIGASRRRRGVLPSRAGRTSRSRIVLFTANLRVHACYNGADDDATRSANNLAAPIVLQVTQSGIDRFATARRARNRRRLSNWSPHGSV
eukprot:SAG11_NODE_4481_length_1879_cov_2.100000_2_plen_127_part_00